MSTPGANQTPQPAMRDGQKMPPLGSFAPPASASKESKKRMRPDKQTPVPPAPLPEAPPSGNRAIPGVANTNKRAKLTHKPITTTDIPAVEPTLTPVMPGPMEPSTAATTSVEELVFFDKVKKFLGNRTANNEFLKVCNLYNQDIIDISTLFYKGSVFFAASPELVALWKKLLNYHPKDELIENQPAPPVGKVSLSNCRGYGPSYRLLPSRVSNLKRQFYLAPMSTF
jgi:paired amphipathic helix protein Sin3a